MHTDVVVVVVGLCVVLLKLVTELQVTLSKTALKMILPTWGRVLQCMHLMVSKLHAWTSCYTVTAAVIL